MKTNKFNYKITYLLGFNLGPDATFSAKFKSLLMNIFVLIRLICFDMLATILFMKEHSDDLITFMIAFYQVPAYGSCILTYIYFSLNKKIINEVFNEIEIIVVKRMKLVDSNVYEKAIKKAEIYAIYPMISFIVFVSFDSILMLMVDATCGIINDDIHTEKWYLPFSYKLVSF